MISYSSELALKKEKLGLWSLKQDFTFSYNNKQYVIKNNFLTDLASVPFPLSLWLKPDGVYKESAVIHDWFLKEMYNGNLNISRKYASNAFLASLRYQNIPMYKIIILYSGVRLYDFCKYLQKDLLK